MAREDDWHVRPIYLRTRLPTAECRRRLEDRVGKPRWQFVLRFLGFALGRHCDKPLQGTIEPCGFDIAETGPQGWGAEDPRTRARWVVLGEWTVIRLQPYATWGFWAGHLFCGIIAGGVLTFMALIIVGSMSDSVIGACLLGFSTVCVATVLRFHSRRLSSLGKDLARRFGVLFEAETIEEAEARQFDMHVSP